MVPDQPNLDGSLGDAIGDQLAREAMLRSMRIVLGTMMQGKGANTHPALYSTRFGDSLGEIMSRIVKIQKEGKFYEGWQNLFDQSMLSEGANKTHREALKLLLDLDIECTLPPPPVKCPPTSSAPTPVYDPDQFEIPEEEQWVEFGRVIEGDPVERPMMSRRIWDWSRMPPVLPPDLPNPELVRALTAHSRTRRQPHPDGDEFRMDSMVELGSRSPDVVPFEREIHRASTPSLVILVDCSGSMGGTPIAQANLAATIVARSALAARTPFTIIPYTWGPILNAAGTSAYDSDYKTGPMVRWGPGLAEPKLPVKFSAGGENDMIGSTILGARHVWGSRAKRRNERRIIITICDGDLHSTYYEGRLSGAHKDLRELPMTLGCEAHLLLIGHNTKEAYEHLGFTNGDFRRRHRCGPEVSDTYIDSHMKPFRQTASGFRSWHHEPEMEEMPKLLSSLARGILEASPI